MYSDGTAVLPAIFFLPFWPKPNRCKITDTNKVRPLILLRSLDVRLGARTSKLAPLHTF